MSWVQNPALVRPSLPSDDKGGRAKRNFKPSCQTGGEWRAVQAGRNAEDGRKRRVFHQRTGQVPTSMCSAVGPGGHRVRERPVTHGRLSLCPCPPPPVSSSPCQAHVDDDDNEKRRRRKRSRSWYTFMQWRDDVLRSPRVYLVVVVIGQALPVESHPPPLKNTVPAKRGDANSVHRARSPQQLGATTSHSKKQTV